MAYSNEMKGRFVLTSRKLYLIYLQIFQYNSIDIWKCGNLIRNVQHSYAQKAFLRLYYSESSGKDEADGRKDGASGGSECAKETNTCGWTVGRATS